jgi:hypothetical protein
MQMYPALAVPQVFQILDTRFCPFFNQIEFVIQKQLLAFNNFTF